VSSRRLRFRRLNRIYAFLFGYFWLPCPACGEMFGGHEAGWATVGTRIACKAHDDWLTDVSLEDRP
jgi:hypothetical protein